MAEKTRQESSLKGIKNINKEYGNKKIILGADFQDNKVKTNGWKESSEKELKPFIGYYSSLGVSYVIPTDISKDGMLNGPSFDVYSKLIKRFKEKYKKKLYR